MMIGFLLILVILAGAFAVIGFWLATRSSSGQSGGGDGAHTVDAGPYPTNGIDDGGSVGVDGGGVASDDG